MDEKTWIDYFTAIGSVATPILVVILSAIGWKLKSRLDRKLDLDNKLRDDRIATYNRVREPFVILLMSDAAWAKDKRNKNKDKNEVALSKMLSLEYRESGFKLSLIGSHSVVRAYNNLMQYFYNTPQLSGGDNIDHFKQGLELLGVFLLEIRRSMGNEATTLSHWDMCEWWMSDTRKIKDGTYKT